MILDAIVDTDADVTQLADWASLPDIIKEKLSEIGTSSDQWDNLVSDPNNQLEAMRLLEDSSALSWDSLPETVKTLLENMGVTGKDQWDTFVTENPLQSYQLLAESWKAAHDSVDACAWGFRISQNNNIIINGCRFVKCAGAVYFDYVFTSAVVDNFVEDCDQGIYIDWGSSKNIVKGNVLQISDGASGDKGIYLTANGEKAKYNIVASNSVFDYNCGIDIAGNYNKIVGNYVMQGNYPSMDYTGSQYNIICGGTYNDISDNYTPGKEYINHGGSTNIFDNNRYQ